MAKSKELKKALADATRYRKELAKKIGIAPSSADIIREDRDHGH